MALFGPMFKEETNFCEFLEGDIPFFFAGNVGSVRQYAFEGCSNLKKVYLGNVSSIASNAFYNCLNLTEVDISGATSYFSLSSSNIIPNNADLKIYTSSKLYNSFHGNENWALYGDKVVNKDGTSGGIDNFLYRTNIESDVIKAVKGEDIDTTCMAATSIRSNMFRNYTNTLSLRLPNVKDISDNVFFNASNLKFYGPNVTNVGYNAFYNASKAILNLSNLTKASVNMCTNANIIYSNFSNIKDVEAYAFRNTIGWGNVNLGRLNSVSDYAFANSDISGVNFGANASIGTNAFNNCNNLTNVNFSNIGSLGNYAFCNCTQLTLNTDMNLTYIGSCCLSNVQVPSIITMTGQNLAQTYLGKFSESNKIWCNITFTNNTELGEGVFENKGVGITSRGNGYISYVGVNAFNNAQLYIDANTFPGSNSANTYIDENAFAYCNVYAIGEVFTIQTNHIGPGAFSYTKANAISIQHMEKTSGVLAKYSGITSELAFVGISNLWLSFPYQLRDFAQYAFYECNVSMFEGNLALNTVYPNCNGSFSYCNVTIYLNTNHANYLLSNSVDLDKYKSNLIKNSTNYVIKAYNGLSTNLVFEARG
jgi:hypothetical protein